MQNSEKYQLMFSLLRCSLFGKPDASEIAVPEDVDWAAVFKEMQAHTVHGLVEPILDQLPFSDPSVKEDWRNSCIHQQARWYQVAAAQQALLELLEANEIPCVVIKGSSAGSYYPHPVLRCPGDIDALVRRCDFDRTVALLNSSGYRFIHDDNAGKNHHYSFQKDGISIELHHRLGIVSNENEALTELFEDGVTDRQRMQIEGFSFAMLPTFQNGLCLLFHIDQHLRSGLGLRQIVDWMMFVSAELSDRVWAEQYRPCLQQLGLETFAITVTALCREYLGLPETIHWCDAADPEVRDELLRYILEKGNFGKKSGIEGQISYVSMVTKNPIQLFRRLQVGGKLNWKAAKKYKILQPFAWIYQVFHILKKLRKNRISGNAFRHLKDTGEEQRNLIDRLGLQMDRNL